MFCRWWLPGVAAAKMPADSAPRRRARPVRMPTGNLGALATTRTVPRQDPAGPRLPARLCRPASLPPARWFLPHRPCIDVAPPGQPRDHASILRKLLRPPFTTNSTRRPLEAVAWFRLFSPIDPLPRPRNDEYHQAPAVCRHVREAHWALSTDIIPGSIRSSNRPTSSACKMLFASSMLMTRATSTRTRQSSRSKPLSASRMTLYVRQLKAS
jgi:hypothetical protein